MVLSGRNLFQGLLRRTGNNLAAGLEARAVARAIPRLFGLIPIDDALEMRADRRAQTDLAIRIAMRGDFLAIQLQDFALAGLYAGEGVALRAAQPLAHHVVRVVGVLGEVTPSPAQDVLAMDVENLRPGIFPLKDRVSRHQCGERTEGHAVAGETRARKLVFSGFSDERQAVVGLDDLAAPAVIDLRAGSIVLEPLFERTVMVAGIVHLAGLMIFAAEDQAIELSARLHPQIEIRIGRVPIGTWRDGAGFHPRAEGVTSIEIQFGLKQERRHQRGGAGERSVGGQDQVLVMDFPLSGFNRPRGDFFGGSVIEDMTAFARQSASQRREVLAGMKNRLLGKGLPPESPTAPCALGTRR